MRSLSLSIFLLATSAAAKSTLYATHYSGTVYTLSLNINGTNNDPSHSLSIVSATDTCGDMPSWLTLDPVSGVLYCSDESGNATVPASLTALSTTQEGKLEEKAKVQDVGAGVNSAFYHGENGSEFIAIAH